MAAKEKTPKVDDLFELADSLVDDAKLRDAMYDRMDALYDQASSDKDEGAGESDDAVHVTMPYARSAIDLVADLASQQKLHISVPAAKETEGALKEADTQEAWLREWLSMNEQQRQRNFTGEMAWLGAQRAVVVTRCLYLDSAIEDGKIITVPILFQVRDPRYVYVEEGPTGPEVVVERRKRSMSEIKRSWPGVLQDKDDPKQDVIWTEYWDKDYVVYWADDEPIKVKGKALRKHRYGVMPYSFGAGRTTPRTAPEKRYQPLLAGVEQTISNIDTWYSILATAGWSSVTNAWAIFSDNYDGKEKQLDITPNSINYFAPDDKVTPIQRSPLPGDFFQLGTQLLTAFQMATFPFSMFGQQSGQVAGYAINMLTQSGRRPLAPIWSAIERCYEQSFKKAVLIAKNVVAPLVGDEIPLIVRGVVEGQSGKKGRAILRELKLNTKQIDDSFDCTCSLDDPMPADEASNARLALELTKGGLLSVGTALEKYKLVSDATAEQERVWVEKVLQELMPKEAIKLAIERGYLPKGTGPQDQPGQPGPGQGPQPGQPPQLTAGPPMQPPIQQGPPQGMPLQGPPSQMMVQQPGPGPEQQMTPEQMQLLQTLMAMSAQGQGQPGMAQPGQQPIDPAMLQQLAGQPQPATLDQMGGVPPVIPSQYGG